MFKTLSAIVMTATILSQPGGNPITNHQPPIKPLIHLDVAKSDPIVVETAPRPNFDREILAPLKTAQAADCRAKGGHLDAVKCIVPEPVPQPQAVAPVVVRTSQAPAPPVGDLATWLYKLRMCESTGNYQANTGNGFLGAYQFMLSTWQSLGTGYSSPIDAPPAVQDAAIIANTKRSSGGLATQNPGCFKKQGLSAFPPGA